MTAREMSRTGAEDHKEVLQKRLTGYINEWLRKWQRQGARLPNHLVASPERSKRKLGLGFGGEVKIFSKVKEKLRNRPAELQPLLNRAEDGIKMFMEFEALSSKSLEKVLETKAGKKSVKKIPVVLNR
ncbi:MAG: hypothetical protein AAGE99_02835 [Chlamydiota bacterium]